MREQGACQCGQWGNIFVFFPNHEFITVSPEKGRQLWESPFPNPPESQVWSAPRGKEGPLNQIWNGSIQLTMSWSINREHLKSWNKKKKTVEAERTFIKDTWLFFQMLWWLNECTNQGQQKLVLKYCFHLFIAQWFLFISFILLTCNRKHNDLTCFRQNKQKFI